MKKNLLFLLIASVASLVSIQTNGQTTKVSEKLHNAISRVEYLNALSGVRPSSVANKTTSTDRAIKISSEYSNYIIGPNVVERYDSTIYTNALARYSELDAFYLNYDVPYPQEKNFDLDGLGNFAARTAIRYTADTTRVFGLGDSLSVIYKANGDPTLFYVKDYNTNEYRVETFTYDASDKLTSYDYKEYDGSGNIAVSNTSNFKYGSNYIVSDQGVAGKDSAILDANGRTVTLYHDSDYETFTYDANGYVATYKGYTGGSLEYDANMSFNANYKLYAYEAKSFLSGTLLFTEKRILVGQAGKLDSVYSKVYDGAGVFVANALAIDITTDSYDNVTMSYFYDQNGVLSDWHHYYYEDVVAGISNLRLPFSDFKIYPNPATQSDIVIAAKETFSYVTVYNVGGQIVMQNTFRPLTEMHLNTSDLNPGSYLITIRSDDGLESTQTFTKM